MHTCLEPECSVWWVGRGGRAEGERGGRGLSVKLVTEGAKMAAGLL